MIVNTDIVMRKGTCIAFDEDGNEVAWIATDSDGCTIAFNDEGALYVLVDYRRDDAPQATGRAGGVEGDAHPE